MPSAQASVIVIEFLPEESLGRYKRQSIIIISIKFFRILGRNYIDNCENTFGDKFCIVI